MSYWGDDPIDDVPDGDLDDADEFVLDCDYPDCCMPGYHFRSECHNGADIEAANREAENEQKFCSCTFGVGAVFHLPECPLRTPQPGYEANS